jgi:hypothetical protein
MVFTLFETGVFIDEIMRESGNFREEKLNKERINSFIERLQIVDPKAANDRTSFWNLYVTHLGAGNPSYSFRIFHGEK